ncbi:MAG: flavin-nucleotide-binding protein [Rhizobacter sp.]|nr:flavin-nucleotide-binding protein [Rhizobacter sp.]
MSVFSPDVLNDRFKVRRLADRACYSREDIYAVIDASHVCHISFIDEGLPTAIPMACWRIADDLYFHSANKGRLSRCVTGQNVCVSIALFDGLVLGHSAFNHSFNYRSVVVHGVVIDVAGEAQKEAAMKAFMDHLIPGRWQDVRPMLAKELRATAVMRLPLAQAVAKVRTGFSDEEADCPDFPTWVGIVPSLARFREPVPDPLLNRVALTPAYLSACKGIDSVEESGNL